MCIRDRALALEPYILLLDEPAAGMNPLETQELMEFIKMLNEGGYTIAVIEHDMKFVMNSCNRILVLNFGQDVYKRQAMFSTVSLEWMALGKFMKSMAVNVWRWRALHCSTMPSIPGSL